MGVMEMIALASAGVRLWNNVAEAVAAGDLPAAEAALQKAREHTQEADAKWLAASGPASS